MTIRTYKRDSGGTSPNNNSPKGPRVRTIKLQNNTKRNNSVTDNKIKGKPLFVGEEEKNKTSEKRSPSRSPRTTHSGGRKPTSRNGSSRGRKPSRPPTRHAGSRRETHASVAIPPVGDNIRIMPLGGVEEIGRNMIAVEIGEDIIVIDAGFQFRDEDTPGIDYILPNIKYLEENKHKVRALIVTHGHLDHIGGIPYIMNRIGNPPIYSRALTTVMIKKRQEEFPHLPPIDIKVVEKNDRITIGNLKVRFFSVSHTIPDAMGIIIETPHGWIATPGDVKLDHVDEEPTDAEKKEYAVFKDQKVLFFMMDSTNVDHPGWSTPERKVTEGMEHIIKNTNGRLIIGTFASQIERMANIIEICERYGKKVVVEGRSMKQNIEIVRTTGYLKVKEGTIITAEQMGNYPPDKIVALVTGAQGDEFAALMRMSMKTHKYFTVTKRDTILLSSSVIPGNENAVQRLKDNLARQGAKLIHYRSSDVFVHSTGHGNRGELEWIHKQVKPKYFMPIHGSHYMLRVHEDLAKSLGMPEDHIVVPDNGTIVEITDKGEKLTTLPQKAPGGPLIVDGFSVGNIQDVVIRDRKMLADDGMFIIVASLNMKTGKLKKSPDVISRGFVYLRESQDLLNNARMVIKKTVETTTKGMNPINFDYIKSQVTDAVSAYLFQKTAKRPVVIPVILGV